jgi:thiol-disulfide isomerase/thioredoxin
MKYLSGLFFLVITISAAVGQSFYLQARVSNFEGSRAYLVQFKGDQHAVIDSSASLDGVFTFQFNAKTKPGVYRVLLGEKGATNFFDEDPQYFDFIYNSENIILTSDFNSPISSMSIIQSKENEIYYRFLRENDLCQAKLNRISPLLALYPPDDPFYPVLFKEFIDLQNSFNRYSSALSEELPGSIVSSIIMVSLIPVVETTGSSEQMKAFIREHYFDLKSFGDVRLMNSQVITKTILDYLGLFRNPALNQSQQEDQFITGIDKIMEVVTGNPVIYDYALNFLVDGFERFQMEKVLVYIAENYIEGGCETDSKKLLQKRLEGYEKMSPGKKAPDILMLDQNGKQVRLYDLDHDYTLVLFWASWCPHCTSFLKQLVKWYPEKNADIEVFAVSIDSSRFSWEERVLMDNYPWINTFSGAGWDGKAPKDYNVYATPTLFLLDREHKIIAKPLTFKEFKKDVDGLVMEEMR